MANGMKSVDVREKLVDALRLDLVGPAEGLGDPAEVLPQAPSRWYLTGFLVPLGAERAQRADESSMEDLPFCYVWMTKLDPGYGSKVNAAYITFKRVTRRTKQRGENDR